MLRWVFYAPPCLFPTRDQLPELERKAEEKRRAGEGLQAAEARVRMEAPKGVDVEILARRVAHCMSWLASAVVHTWGHTLDEKQNEWFLQLICHAESEYSRVCDENGCFIGLNYIVCASVLGIFHRRDTHILPF